jgi:hypothetical protein
MKLLKLNENHDDDASGATYLVPIKNTVRFWLAIDHTWAGLSF